MKVSYNWLKDYFGDTAPTPTEIADLLTFHAFEIDGVEVVGDDTVIDVNVLPNRSSDCLSHRGIAREVATQTGRALAVDPLDHDPKAVLGDTPAAIKVAIADESLCPRFTATLIEGVEIKESPAWLQARLTAIGQRPINNIVDATNYVMFALGQPLHAYDADLFPQVDGAWSFVVRAAQADETVSLIAEGGKDEDRIVTLAGGELLIVDGSSGTPIGLAGVKGGRFAGVHAGTKRVIIEAAHFDPIRTRQTARGLGIVIDASKRFENEPSRDLPLYAQADIVALIAEIAGGTYAGYIDVYPKPKTNPAVLVTRAKTNSLLGTTLTVAEMGEILARVGCQVVPQDNDTLTATGPFERTDLHIEEDFIEEIGRTYGYQHVAAVVPETVPLRELNVRHYYSEKIRAALIANGFSEVITSSFRAKDQIKLFNALASDKSCLRSALTPNLIDVLEKNSRYVDLFGANDTRVFEIGTVFTKGEGTVTEHVAVALGVQTKVGGYSKHDTAKVAEAKAAVEAVLGVMIAWHDTEGVAECNLSALLQTLPTPEAYEPVAVAAEKKYRPFSPYPHISRDIALWVNDDTEAAAVATVLKAHAGSLAIRVDLFDEFSKDGRTSYAFRLVFQSNEKTLTDDEVNTYMEAVNVAVAQQGWEVR